MKICVFCIFIFCVPLLFAAESRVDHRDLWWQVKMDLTVEGKYEFKEKTEGEGDLSGHYTIKISSVGGMARDNGDYIFYPGKSEVEKVEWFELRHGRAANLSDQIKPKLESHYVLRDKGKIYMEFEVISPWLEMERLAGYPQLLLPRSNENQSINARDKYNRDVVEGNNDISFVEEPIYNEEEVNRDFSWRWRRQGITGSHNHEVCVTVAIRRFRRETDRSGKID